MSGQDAAGSEVSRRAARAFLETALKTRGEIPNALASIVSLAVRSRDPLPPGTLTLIERARGLALGRHDYVFLHAHATPQPACRAT